MEKHVTCPICQEHIPDHGYGDYRCGNCAAEFQVKQLTGEELAQLQPGPIQHDSLPAQLQEVVEWTFQVVGHYLYPTLEQWELGFMRDMHPESEIRVWSRIALAFIRYHQQRGLPLRDDETERNLIGKLVKISSGVDPTDEEARFIKDCYMNPEG